MKMNIMVMESYGRYSMGHKSIVGPNTVQEMKKIGDRPRLPSKLHIFEDLGLPLQSLIIGFELSFGSTYH